VRDVLVARMIAAGMQGYALALPTPRRISEKALARLDVPVLVVVAGRSRMHDSRRAAETARRVLRHGHVVVYEGASHAVNGECPDRIVADLAAFRRPLR
jgi:pimeloyl-ACP methyl ester carboxylesterase